MNAVFEARSRRGIETTEFCIVFEGSKASDVTLANEQLLWDQSHDKRMRRAIREVHQRETATVK